MRVEEAFVGARLVDSLPYSQGGTAEQAKKLKDSGIDGFIGYLGAINQTRLGHILNAGLSFMAVTFAGEYFDGPTDELAHIKALGLPQDTTIWLDLEGIKSYNTPPQNLISKINTWAKALDNAGYQPGLYIGSPQPLTGDELARLAVVRYWKAPSRILDRNGNAWDGPTGIGHCLLQCWPSVHWADTGVFVDINVVSQDFRGRLPNWIIA